MITPIETHGDFFVKRDDLWSEQGVAFGGKARTAGLICRAVRRAGGKGICVAVDRNSSVPGMLSRVCLFNNIGLHLFLPESKGTLPKVFIEAKANNAQLHPCRCGYMSVRKKRLREFIAKNPGFQEVGLGLAFNGLGTEHTGQQTDNIPHHVQRVVVPVGSGGMLRGIILGLLGRSCPPEVLGICVGNPPTLGIPTPPWVKLIRSSVSFNKEVVAEIPGGPKLDPVYEAKCFEFLRPKDLLWIVCHRDTE